MMRVRYLVHAAALFTLGALLAGCRTAPHSREVTVPAKAVADPVEIEMRFTDDSIRKYIATFPGFYALTKEILETGERDPDSETSRHRIRELSKKNAEHVAGQGWSGLDVFVEFNGKVVYYLTVYQVLKRYLSIQSRYPQAKALHREQMKLLETELGKDGFSVLRRNDWRLRRMYARAGMKELGQTR
jgi:hypothetical protein